MSAKDDDSCIRNLELCTKAVRDWLLQNGMLLTPSKSEVLLVAGRMQALKFAGGTDVSVAGSDITFAVQLKKPRSCHRSFSIIRSACEEYC